ncbi:MAG: hypothetical protein AAFN50_13425, partial [Pseudomonadota bacterium]
IHIHVAPHLNHGIDDCGVIRVIDDVAEGVENEAQLSFLQRQGCTYAQGLLFGDPMSSDNYLELLLAQVEGTDTHRALFA